MSSSPSCTKLTTCTVSAIFLQILGLSIFIFGFFPIKPTLSGVSGPESYIAPKCNSVNENITLPSHQLRSLYKDISGVPPLFDRLILMVIDGLPAEFVLGKDDHPPSQDMMEAMPYTQSLLSNGTAIGYHAKAAPPTVTMPRLKAMVSGAIGGFLDVAFNFNTQAFLDDNLIGQFHSIGWNMVMHGDETWIKLFPGLFTRHDGVSSFFVKDTIEVDHNVSRHLEAELLTKDWDLLILHYLGLDHVGHIGGRKSLLMAPKLNEMDEVIKMIHGSSILRHDHHHGNTLLMVVSDHGMTDSGNHGGSSYEETDSLALFIGLGSKPQDYATATCNAAFQVDIAPTLALLFGVPIPKNNVGVLIARSFVSLTEGEQLRALELNSWQLLRLLQAQLPGLQCGDCGDRSCGDMNNAKNLESSECEGSVEQILCCLFSKAAALHSNWMCTKDQNLRSNSSNDFTETVAAYNEFLRTASKWLSRTATDKPHNLLAFGIATMLISCMMFLSIQVCLCKAVHIRERQSFPDLRKYTYKWHLDDAFVLLMILILAFSMGSSSMVEEEQYTLHFMTCTIYLIFVRKSCQSPSSFNVNKDQEYNYSRTASVVLVLIFGRILRGWHQGGVNWVHLPDILKWLEKADLRITKSIQIVSAVILTGLSSFALYMFKLKREFILVVRVSLFVSGLIVLLYIMRYQEQSFAASSNHSMLVVRSFYTILITTIVLAVLGSPWVMPISNSTNHSSAEFKLTSSFSVDHGVTYPLLGLQASIYFIGWICASCWCLLQLIVQKPTNAMPTLLLFSQILASLFYFSVGSLHHKQWVEVAALYFLGLTGHFSHGNSNTLATIDVAGAYIGISSHSTLFSGILMFIITYASPLLCLLSTTMYISLKDINYLLVCEDTDLGHLLQFFLGIPSLVPLSINSVMLTTFSIILLLMRNHLFVWSVFSPKYLYVCATTVCIYVGVFIVSATVIYTCLVFLFRKKMFNSKGDISVRT